MAQRIERDRDGLFDRDDKIFAHTPETVGVGDAERVLSLCICVERITVGGVCGHEACALRIELDDFVHADVDLREIVFVEIALAEHFATSEDVLLLEFALGAKHVVGGVEFLVLRSHGFGARFVLLGELIDIAAEIVDFFALFGNLDVLLCEFFAQGVHLFGHLVELLVERGDASLHGFAQLRVARLRLLELLAQVGDEFVVELDIFLNIFEILENHFLAARFSVLAFFGDTALRLVDFAESVLDFAHGRYHIIEFAFLLVEYLLERIGRSDFYDVLLLFLRFARYDAHQTKRGHEEEYHFFHIDSYL